MNGIRLSAMILTLLLSGCEMLPWQPLSTQPLRTAGDKLSSPASLAASEPPVAPGEAAATSESLTLQLPDHRARAALAGSQAPAMGPPTVTSLPQGSVRTQGVDLQAGIPVRTTVTTDGDARYPLAKGNFAYKPVPLWPALQLAQVGPLTPFEDTGLLPTPVNAVSVVTPEPQSQLCATPAVASSLDAGPRQNWAVRKTRSMAQQLLGRWLEASEPERDERPVALEPVAGQRFPLLAAESELVLRGQFTAQGLQLTAALISDQQEPALHLLYLEQRDCQRAWPDRWQVERFWPSVTAAGRATAVFSPGAGHFRVEQGEAAVLAGNSDQARLIHYQQLLAAQAPEPVWQLLGFSQPEQGAQVMVGQFSRIESAALRADTVLVVHVARPMQRRYRTEAQVYLMDVNGQGEVQFRPL